ncbi:MAG TPA: prepilin peptidase, partial [Gaiellaceae bacterium]
VPEGRSIVSPGSACPHCGVEIRPIDNIPVLSWLFLRARCRDCGGPISWRYPALELATALLVAGCFADFGVTWHAAAGAVFCTALVVISAIDFEHRIVPNKIVLPAAVVVLVLMLVWKLSIEWPIAGFGAALFLFIAALAYPRGMGMGDVKLALLLGFGTGKSVPLALFSGMVAALVPSIVLFARHGSAARKMAIPFAPFLALGGLIALFAGNHVVHWYLHTR